MDYEKLRYSWRNPLVPTFMQPTPRNPFSLKFHMSYPEVVPIVIICILDMSWMVFSSIYAFKRTEVLMFNCQQKEEEMYDLLIHPYNRKFYTESQTFCPQQSLYDTYMEMMQAQEKRDQDCPKTKKAQCNPFDAPEGDEK
ncbi:unnamed protein product [Brassicogethes aeneus]|uniref:Uncharacterized protein n=1 Tax=Brassicogethes aeneus TaxID=1431903 RepID=A0A9P0AZB2_BRAAE|nr:unnamed protein product [Brassicogethes aeneus]